MPQHIPRGLVDDAFLRSLSLAQRRKIKLTSPLLPDSEVDTIFEKLANPSHLRESEPDHR